LLCFICLKVVLVFYYCSISSRFFSFNFF